MDISSQREHACALRHCKITEKINDSYSWATYGDYKVIVMNDNQYINCTKLCSTNGKKFKHFLENYIRDKINKDDIIIKNGGQNQLIKGTYINKILLPKVIDWMTRDKNFQRETIIVQKLNETLKGKLEECTDVGRIDILTDTEIIEVKEYKGWKGALGQILSYSHYHPNKKMRIHLFDVKNNDIKIVEEIYKKYNVTLTWE